MNNFCRSICVPSLVSVKKKKYIYKKLIYIYIPTIHGHSAGRRGLFPEVLYWLFIM